MRDFPAGFYADLQLQFAMIEEALGQEFDPLASTPLHPVLLGAPPEAYSDGPRVTHDAAIMVRWGERDDA
jgi:hypothetical protein